jgi:hypothetical protein
MASILPLEEMSVEEKLRAMELLWDDLCRRSEGVASPAWHEDVLAERKDALERGEDRFEDWDLAKKDIRSRIS